MRILIVEIVDIHAASNLLRSFQDLASLCLLRFGNLRAPDSANKA